jgi:two-component sensor histidine kinase
VDRVLQNLLALTAPEEHRARIDPIDAARLLERLRSEFRTEAETRGLELEVEADPNLVFPSDAHTLEQVLVNLMTNALKFTPNGGRVSLRATRVRGAVLPGRLALLGGGFGVRPAFVHLEVHDTGIGLSDEARRRLFEPFYRSREAVERGISGSGLGLAVARRLVHLLHADLRPLPVPGGGTRFLLTLPADTDTWDLVHRVDTALLDLAPRLRRGPETLVVVRDPDATDRGRAESVAAALRESVPGPAAAVHVLSATTWVVCTPASVRDVLESIGPALVAALGAERLGNVALHAQRVPLGGSADEHLLQALVRCRHPLAAVARPGPAAASGEVTRAPHPARR